MLGDFLVVASSVVTLFFMMGVGFFFGKRGMLYSDTLSQLSRLLLTVVCPCTVINALQVERSTQLLAGMGQALLLVAASYVVFGGAAHFLFPRQSAPTRAALRFGTVYGNVGFMGLPLVMSVLGEGAVPYCAMGIAVFNVANWTHGVTVMGQKGSLRRAVLNPGVIGFAIAMALFVGGVALPGPVRSAVEYISGLNTPLAMVVIGGQMAGADLAATFQGWTAIWGCGSQAGGDAPGDYCSAVPPGTGSYDVPHAGDSGWLPHRRHHQHVLSDVRPGYRIRRAVGDFVHPAVHGHPSHGSPVGPNGVLSV